MTMKKIFIYFTISVFFIFYVCGVVLSQESPKILKIASQEKIVLVEIEKKIRTICIGDKLENYGVLSEVFSNKLVFKKIKNKRIETIIVTIENGSQTITRISKQSKDKLMQIPLQ